VTMMIMGRRGEVPSLAPSAPEGSGPVWSTGSPPHSCSVLCRLMWAYLLNPAVRIKPYRAAAHLRAVPMHRVTVAAVRADVRKAHWPTRALNGSRWFGVPHP
jgi:hypothetical protein